MKTTSQYNGFQLTNCPICDKKFTTKIINILIYEPLTILKEEYFEVRDDPKKINELINDKIERQKKCILYRFEQAKENEKLWEKILLKDLKKMKEKEKELNENN